MGFSRESPKKFMKGVSPSLLMKKKNNIVTQRNDRFCRSSSMGNVGAVRGAFHKNGKKAAAVFPESEDVGANDQLECARLADEKDFMWLSSDCKSPSFSFEDHFTWATAVFPESEDVGANDQLECARLADEKDFMWLSSDCKSPSFSFEDHFTWATAVFPESEDVGANDQLECARLADEKDFMWLSSDCKSPSFSFEDHFTWATAVFPESEDVGANDQLECASLTDEKDCMWLSSDCKSPSFSFEDHISWDACELESKNLSFDRLFSLLPSKSSDLFLNNGTHFFAGSYASPIEEASLVLGRTSDGVEMVEHNDSKEKEVGDWKLNSAANCLEDSSVPFSESDGLHHESSLFLDSSVPCSDASSLMGEFDQAGVLASLLEKEVVDWKLNSTANCLEDSSVPSSESDGSHHESSLFVDSSVPYTDASSLMGEFDQASVQVSLLEKEVVDWKLNSTANCLENSSVPFSESDGSHHESSLFVDSSVPCTDASSLMGEFDQASVQVSLLDLEREDSKWISYKDPGFDVLQSDFPSPSYKKNWNSEVEFSQCGSSPSVEQKHEEFSHASPSVGVSEAPNKGNINTDEPLFWPFQRKFEWNDMILWDSFCISPRKTLRKIGSCERSCTPRSTGLRVNERKMNLKEGCKRSLVFNSGSKVSTSMECNRTDGKKSIKRSSTMPARLNRSSKDSLRKKAPNTKYKMEEETISNKAQTETLMEDLKFRDEVFVSNDDIPIETLIGLNEFDGHEGVDQEFNRCQFMLDE